MKKFIFTFNYAINYGAFLQSFALANFDDECVVADLMPTSFKNFRYSVGPDARKKYPFIWIFLAVFRFSKRFLFSRFYKFKENKKINISKRFFNWNSKNARIFLDGCTAIVGSDQVWNPKLIEGNEPIFFAQNANYAKRIAYAVSIGMEKWPLDFERKNVSSVKQFNFVSVREKSACDYLTSIGVKDVAWVCDPTILHNGDFYRKSFPNDISEPSYVFAYTIREHVPQDYLDFDVVKKISVCAGNYRNIVSVTNWLGYIDKAEYIVTDSFHCVVFCLLFHKKFVVLLNQSRGKGMNERFASLLGRVKLENRCVSTSLSGNIVKEIMNAEINWNLVDEILEDWRIFSMNWLKKALES